MLTIYINISYYDQVNKHIKSNIHQQEPSLTWFKIRVSWNVKAVCVFTNCIRREWKWMRKQQYLQQPFSSLEGGIKKQS